MCLLKPIFNDQNYPNLKPSIIEHIVSALFTDQIMKDKWINLCEIANKVCLTHSLFSDQMYHKLKH